MASVRRLRRLLAVVFATLAMVAGFGVLPPATVQAFDLPVHDRIIRDALPVAEVDNTAILQILVGPGPGSGAVGADAFPAEAFRHVDNAANPGEICARVQEAWNFYTPVLMNGAQPAGPSGTDLVDGPAARAAFGGLAHALQDFYAHSNWVEDNIGVGQPERPGPRLMPTCDPAALPADLNTGYYSVEFGALGCPPAGPPPGFSECHSTLNKDGPTTPRGAAPVPGTPWNHFDVAARLATQATTELYSLVRNVVVSAKGECVARNLFQADRREPCMP